MHRLINRFTKPESDIIAQGEISRSMYFVINGSCLPLIQDMKMKLHRMEVLDIGCHFGEIALIYDIPRTATITSLGYCTLAELNLENFTIVANKIPGFA
jgi:CRP-like cAMP-binding protein